MLGFHGLAGTLCDKLFLLLDRPHPADDTKINFADADCLSDHSNQRVIDAL
jgi:hypothetical protein